MKFNLPATHPRIDVWRCKNPVDRAEKTVAVLVLLLELAQIEEGGAVRWVFPSRTRREKRDDDYAILAGVFFWFYFSSIPAGGICIRRNEGESFRR